MPRDYAQRKTAGPPKGRSRPQAASEPGSGLPAWVWMFVGLTLGLMVAAGAYIALAPAPLGTDASPVGAHSPPPEGVVGATGTERPRAELPPPVDPEFGFYQAVKDYEVPTQPGVYDPGQRPGADRPRLLQAGSFPDATAAESRMAELLLLDVPARVTRATLPDGRETFRVVVGPDKDLDRLHALQSRLYQHNIESIIRVAPES